MGLYQVTNVPVMEPLRDIDVDVDGETLRFWNIDKRDRDNKAKGWGIATTFIGDHMFEPEMRHALRKMYGEDVVYALSRGIELGYAKAQSDIRNALGVKP